MSVQLWIRYSYVMAYYIYIKYTHTHKHTHDVRIFYHQSKYLIRQNIHYNFPSQKVEKNNGTIYQNLIVSISIDETIVIFLFFFVYSLNIPQYMCNQKCVVFFFTLLLDQIVRIFYFIQGKAQRQSSMDWLSNTWQVEILQQ